LAAPLATLTVVNPVVAAVVGITMFGETFRYGTTGTALALSCGVVAAGGLILLTSERIARTESVPEPVQPVELPAQAEEPVRVGDVQVRVPSSAEELLAVLPGQTTTPREEALVAVAESAVLEDPADPAESEEQPIFYVGPLYGASYIPMPVLDRHRMRVKS
ncbi:MAG: hypothetical protein HOQ47_21790, partial [Streptomyces sp.]|nr:hypothetical protein [Streptomyces sp.]NUS78997.1 hypothetical protein [Streptomyces sp.]